MKNQLAITTKKKIVTEFDQKLIEQHLNFFEVLELEGLHLGKSIQKSSILELTITIFSYNFKIHLESNEIRSPNYTHAENGIILNDTISSCQTYKGTVDETGEEVRLTITENGMYGYIQLNERKIILDFLSKFQISSKLKQMIIVYYEDDIIKTENSFCGIRTDKELKFLEQVSSSVKKDTSSIPTCRYLKLATEADFAFYEIYDVDTNLAILTIINMIQPLYESTFDVYIRVTFQNVWTSNDPYTGDPSTYTGAEILVDEFRIYWETNFSRINRDVTHLFSGVNAYLPGQYGIVYEIGTICRLATQSYGLTRERIGAYVTTAHEIGHNFGGIHNDGINCLSNGSIMCTGDQRGIPMYFSPASISRISNFIDTYGNCLAPELYFAIDGPYTICSSQFYQLIGLPSTDTVSWQISPSHAGVISGTGHSCTITRNITFNGSITLTATVSSNCGTFGISRTLWGGIAIGASVDGMMDVPIYQANMYMVQNLMIPLSEVTAFSWFAIPLNGGGGGISEVQPGVASAWFDTPGEYLLGVNIYNICGHYETPTISVYAY